MVNINDILAELNSVKNEDSKTNNFDWEWISQRISENEKRQDKLEEWQKKLEKASNYLNYLLWVLLTLIIWSILVWFTDTFIIYQWVKEDYIIQTQNIETQIKLFNKDLDKIRYDNKRTIELDKEKYDNLEKIIEKEVELQLSKKIIELKLNIK